MINEIKLKLQNKNELVPLYYFKKNSKLQVRSMKTFFS